MATFYFMKVGVVGANTSPMQQNKACCRVSEHWRNSIDTSYLASMVLCGKECGSIAICVPLHILP